MSTNSISDYLYGLILTTAIVTMFLTPFISNLTTPLYARQQKRRSCEPIQTINLPKADLSDHVVIAGQDVLATMSPVCCNGLISPLW
ncbi:MAG: hypothetical protein R2867_44510 [Caldilineaceae bacterium]